ncbi:protein FAR-RED IMPAIRED RESPONSE 1-like [Arachis hypogaea]|uniref:protein FAR-RED IMPAIRED RESPONSE 1-like n=1 Tax=Arachis hypogaea TaxID=3818 RepID=UPI000DECDC32|nr:protein FAR-RED IMPAIRED RESPONSE 1-like [Arachis hypogaea]
MTLDDLRLWECSSWCSSVVQWSVEWSDVPKVGICFGTIEDANQFYQNYAKRVGFVTKIRFTRRVGKDKVPKNQMITCNREGKRKSRVSPIEKTNPRTNYNCPARISIRLNKEGLWIISKVCLDHSHPCDPEMAKLLTRNREMTIHMCRVIERNDEAGVRPSKTYQVLVGEAGGFSKINLMEKDVRNYLSRKVRNVTEEMDAREMLKYFTRMKEMNSDFYFDIELDQNKRLKTIFWADARSRAAYEYFGDIVSFDTTYKTNRYDMPFGSFVGVNHHGNSVLLGCGMLTKENSGSFTWLFNAWLTCMHGKAPKGIITDKCLGIRAGIENVMPETRHRLCIWHITKKIPEKFKRHKRYEELQSDLNNIVWESISEDDFQNQWEDFLIEYGLEDNKWLSDIYEERHRWVPIFLDNFFWAGMRSTQRSESMHSYFDKFINNKSLLIQFVKQYDNCLGWKEQQEREADVEDYKSIIPCATNSLIEKQFQGAYTNAKFKEVQKQFRKKANCILHLMKAVSTSKVYSILEDVSTSKERVYEVNYNAETKDITCMCQMFESRGILCRHSLVVLGHERVREIPRRYILDRWSKLVKRRHSDIKSSHDPSLLNPKTERFDDLCSHSNSVAQFASQTKETIDILHRYLDMAMAECQKHVANSSSNANELDNLLTLEDGSKDGGKDALSIFVGGCIISIQGIKSPPYVFTKGRPTNRLGSEKDKMIKKKTEAKKRKSEITEKEDNQHIGDIQSLPFNEQVHPILQDANYNVNEGFESDSMGASMGGFMSLLNSIHSYQFSNVD